MKTGPRHPLMSEFLASLSNAFRHANLGPEAAASIHRVEDALRKPGESATAQPMRRPVCRYLDGALAEAASASAPLARLASAFRALEPSLAWRPRVATGPFASDNWLSGHANATVVGLGGLEERPDLAVGASLLAPHVRYPDHHHGPEEVYLVLTRGRFRHGGSGWFEPGAGGTLYNEPDICHAMASNDGPLLAIWCLWNVRRPDASART